MIEETSILFSFYTYQYVESFYYKIVDPLVSYYAEVRVSQSDGERRQAHVWDRRLVETLERDIQNRHQFSPVFSKIRHRYVLDNIYKCIRLAQHS